MHHRPFICCCFGVSTIVAPVLARDTRMSANLVGAVLKEVTGFGTSTYDLAFPYPPSLYKTLRPADGRPNKPALFEWVRRLRGGGPVTEVVLSA